MKEKDIELTDDQEKALKAVFQWKKLNIHIDIDNAFFNLYGAAGTGKSTVVKEILKILDGRICVAAPTHKAKDVISRITEKPGLTIHSLLGLRPNLNLDSYNPNNPQYVSSAEEQITKFDYIIIDECSMLNKALTRELMKKAGQYKKRLLFVGDAYQLPPIGEGVSKTFGVKHTAGLFEVVRQKNSSPNQQLLLDARLDIDNNTSKLPLLFKKPLKQFNVNDDNKEQGFIITNDKEEFYNKMIELYKQPDAEQDMNFVKTIAYTNEAVESLNKYIKNRINPSESLIAEGDYLLGYDTLMDNNDIVVVQNSSDYYIYSLYYSEVTILKNVYKFYNAVVSESGKTLRILHPDSYPTFYEAIKNLYDNAIKYRAWRPYYSYLKNFVLLQDFYHDKGTNQYGKPEKIAKKNIDLGYAITVHKAQGSTYNNVAIIYSNFNKCFKANEKRQLTYVALSRTSLLNLIYI